MTDRSLGGVVALAAALWVSAATAQMIDFGKYPDLTGQWKRPPGVGIQWDPTKPPGLGQQAPLIPEYQAMLEASIKDTSPAGRDWTVFSGGFWVVPQEGFEPPTPSLRMMCSTS